MKITSPAATAAGSALLTILVVMFASCSTTPTTFQLQVNYAPVGKIIKYTQESHRVGVIYKNEQKVKEVDLKIQGEITYTTQEILPGGDAVITEKNRWNWDEPAGDSGQVKRITKDYTYQVRISPSGKVADLKMVDASSPAWEDYIRLYCEQGMPVFPDQKISPGYSWTQSMSVTLVDSSSANAATTYRVKGVARKMGYDCAIIEYTGNLALPIFLDPADTLKLTGIDRIEMSGIMYFAIETGIAINSEEKRRVISERTYTKEGQVNRQRGESEEVISYSLVSIEGT